MQNHNQNTLQSVSTLLGSLHTLIDGLTPMTTEKPNNDPVINNASNESAKPENANRASMHEVNTLGAEFADVHAAMQWVSHQANNPIKNRWSEEERFAWSDLPELYRTIKPLMYQAGLFHSQTMKTNADGVPEIITTFRHIPTGTTHTERLETTGTDIEKQLKKSGKNLDEHQRWGWTMTYCRRYALYAALGLQPDDNGDLDAISRRGRRTRPQTSPATSTQREWLPMPGKDGEAAERAAVAMGAVPFTAEEHARAAEQERRFAPLTPEEADFIGRVTRPLKGDLRELDGIQRTLEQELFAKARAGEVTFYDEEDQRRALYHVWLEACKEYDGMVTARIITGSDEEADELIERHYGHDDTDADLSADELARLEAKRNKLREDVANGKMMADVEDADELDEIYASVKGGEVPQPPFPEEPKLPAVDLTSEHAVLMRQKVTLCQEIADGNGSHDEKVTLIKQVLSRADFQASAEINEILSRLTNTGAPSSSKIGIGEDDIPY
ncbi:ERF family protein [Klebsiella aerogenes]|uniref:ERF family protein n=1 Tax=Klebsiella aerogenes TaxID=548 RepID=UPI0009BE656D|nr:ERF family protein [Klebsiella aerogenes]